MSKITPQDRVILEALRQSTPCQTHLVATRAKLRTQSKDETAARHLIKLTKLGLVERIGTRMFPEWKITSAGSFLLDPDSAPSVPSADQGGDFKLWQLVRWTSSGVEKIGNIVAIVPAGMKPSDIGHPKAGGGGMGRDVISYVVQGRKVRRPKGAGSEVYGPKALYWPVVQLLSAVTSGNPEDSSAAGEQK